MIMLEIASVTWIVTSAVAAIGVGSALLVLVVKVRYQSSKLAQAKQQIDALTINLTALCAGSVGANKRISRLEQHDRELKSRQDNIESRDQHDQSYGEAIQMVRHGASALRLTDELGLGNHEAQLIVRLHGMKKAG